jgi:uncharacterized protein (DUF58 family)
MRATRRYRATAAVGLALAGLAVLLARPLLLVGAAGVGAWLLARQVAFLRELRRVDAALEVDASLTPDRLAVDDRATLAITASLDASTPLDLSLAPDLPVAVSTIDGDDLAVTVTEGTASTTATVTCRTAGVFAVEPPTLAASDGLLTEQLRRGPARTLTVEPRVPRNVHVGEGGEELGILYERGDDRRGDSGLDLAGVREYVPGDATRHIDWNATARLNEPHVREFERATDRTTVLVVDHREPMGAGPADETKLDYVRTVALAVANAARDREEPLGLYTVGTDGTTGAWEPRSTRDHYETVRHRLQVLEPDAGNGTAHGPRRTPEAAHRAADRLRADGGRFADRLRPFLETGGADVELVADDPLFETVRTVQSAVQGSVRTVILTDDTDRTELVESVRLAARGANTVDVFLTPTALFEPGGLSDLEAAYGRFVDFEEFRRDLTGTGVAAFEVAPGDRVDAVLADRSEPRTRGGAT